MKELMPYVPIVGGFLIIYAIVYFYNLKHMKKVAGGYLDKYPNAVKVYPKVTNYGVASSRIEIITVDGETPAYFTEGLTQGAYVKPGKSILQVRFSSDRMGVMYRSVQKYTDVVPVEVDLQEGKEYLISFDTKEEMFKINEKSE